MPVIVAPITTKKIERIYEQDVFLPEGEGRLKAGMNFSFCPV
jgi:hypothetical protein